jgi:nucleotide-binding universal stress UspA family protein
MAEIVPTLRRLVVGTRTVVHLLAVRPSPRVPEPEDDRPGYPDDLLLQGLAPAPPGSIRPARPQRRVFLDDVLAHEHAVWDNYLQRLGSQLAYAGVVVQREVRFGDSLTETLAAADRHRLPLVALAAQPQRWWQRLLRPSLAHRLLGQPSVSVLIA